jgi:hypothetical protein
MSGAGETGGEGMSDMGGMGAPEEELKSVKEIGRIYELKKIYARLTSLESFLAHESDEVLLNTRTLISQSIELFYVVASNLESYKENLDEIIVMYYKFLREIYYKVRTYFKKQITET